MHATNYLGKFRLDGKTALITGGTRGIGLAIAYAFGEAGAKIYLAAREENYEDDGAILDAGYDVTFVKADLSTRDAAMNLANTVLDSAGQIDILVNNAGVAIHGDSTDYTEESWRKIMSLNLDAVFWCSQAVLPSMRRNGGGNIINVGSISGLVSNIPQNQAGYNSSKAAVHMMTKSLASEFAEENIRVNAIAPGYIDTDMSRGGFDNPEWFPVWRDMTPMKRVGRPDEVAAATLFLASEAASYITGAVLVIDGGYTTR